MAFKQRSSGPFKMMGSSPAKNGPNLSPKLLALKKEREATSIAGKITKFGEGSNIIPDADDTVSKNFNTKGNKGTVGKTPGFSTTKIGKAKKILKKTAKFTSSKALGVLGFMGAGTLSATATPKKNQGKKDSYSDDIQKIIPKTKKKSIWNNKKKIIKY
tara:strand:+ start:49 stop:525 length:477 start_codon:yes stop_codon:yes gene_type:complete